MPQTSSLCARTCGPAILAVSLLACLLLAPRVEAASETPGDTFAVSLATAGAFAETGTAPPVSISADGRYVAFVSSSPNLSPEAPAGDAEVYVKDLTTGAVRLVSRASGETGAPAAPVPIGEHAARQIEAAEISGDGRYVVFASSAHNLVPGLPLASEVNEELFFDHVYRRDLQSGETVLIDRADGAAGAIAPAQARLSSISEDGRRVVFGSRTEDLEDPNGAHAEGNETSYMRDPQAGTTAAVGRASDAAGETGALAAEGSFEGKLTPDGRYVVFSSSSANLSPEANGFFQVYRRDLQSGDTVLVSRANPTLGAPLGEPSDGEAFEPAFLGGDGCRVAFTALEAPDLFAAGKAPVSATYLRDLCSNPPRTTLLSVDEEGHPFEEAVPAGADRGGAEVLLKAAAAGAASHLYLHDLATGATTLLDRAGGAGAPGNQGIELGALAAGGCRAVFTSAATNLSADAPPAGGSSQQLQVYARQLAPCVPRSTPPKGEGPVPTSPPFSIGVSLVTARRLWLDFDAAASARAQIKHLLGHRRQRLVRSLQAVALGPETVKLRFRRLPRGIYRISIEPRVAGAKPQSLRLVVGHAPTGRRVGAAPSALPIGRLQ